jgi:hypothetical protein
MNALKRTFQHLARLLGPDRALWRPFVVAAVIEGLFLLGLWIAPHPPFAPFLAPPVAFIFGERALHYPWHPLLLYHAMRFTHDAATLLIGAYLSGIACAMVRQRYEGRGLSVSEARRSGQVRYVTVTLIWLVSWAIAQSVVRGLPFLIAQPTAQRWVIIGVVVILQAIFVYAIPIAVFTRSSWWKSLWNGLRETLLHLPGTLVVILPPLALIVAASTLAPPMRVERFSLRTIPEFSLLFVAGRLMVWTLADALMTIGVANLWWAHRLPSPHSPPASAAPARRGLGGTIRWALPLACCLAIAVLVPSRNHSYVAERLLWRVQQMARGLPAAEQASEEQLALVGGALEHVIQAAPGTAGAAQAQMAIASLHARRGAYALAREAYVKAISTYDQFPKVNLQARLMLAKIYGVEQKWTEAAGVYAGIAERYPWSPIGLVSPLYAAQILERHGDAEQASHAYEQAVTQYTDLARHAPTKELEARAQQYADEAKRRAAGTTDQD